MGFFYLHLLRQGIRGLKNQGNGNHIIDLTYLDCPTVLSDQKLGINHPLLGLTTPGQTGVGLSLSSLTSDPELSGHLSCFKGYFGYEGHKEYSETIIRFPLRNVKSEIADGNYDVTSVRQKLINPLILEAEQALLFLKNVFSIEIYERVNGQDISLFRTEVPSAHRDNVRLFRADMVRFASSEEYKVKTKIFVCLFPTISHGGCVGETQTVWLILNVIGFAANNVDLRQFYCDQQPDYLPWVGIALATGVRDVSRCGRWEFEWNEDNPSQVFNAISAAFKSPFIVDTDTELDIASGKIYCFLPTPVHSKFPFHFHGYFSLSSNRRAIPWPSNDNESETGARWNFLLCESLGSISYALFYFISTKALKHPSPILYHYQLLSRWSALEPCNTPFNSILCGGLQRLSDVFLLLYTQQQGGRWIPVSEGIFLPSLTGQCIIHESICLELMEALDQPIIDIPESIHAVILSIPPVKQQIIQRTLTPSMIRELLIMHSSSIHLKKFLSSREKSIPLLEVILTLCSDNLPPERIREILLGVPLLPIVSSTEPQIFSAGHNSVYISTDTAALLSIFPGLEGSFVDPSIPVKLHSKLLSIASRGTSLSLCDLSNLSDAPHLFSQLMSQSLSSHFEFKQNTPIKWTPTGQTHPPSNWISSVFQFIGNSKSLLTAVAPLPLLPQNIITDNEITLLPIQSESIYIERSEDDNLAPLEELLGMSGCTLCVRQQFIVRFDEFVLRPIPKGLIPALQSQTVLNSFALALERSCVITIEQRIYLIELLIPILTTQNSRVISQLPLFINTNEQWMRIRPGTILPPLAIPHGIRYPAHFISPFNSSVTKLYNKLGLPSLSNDQFLQIHLMPYLQSQQDPVTRNCLILFILENLKLFDSTYLKNTGWILDSSTEGNNKLYPPSKLIDPRDHILVQLISNHPRGVFANSMLEDYFDIMKKHLDLRSHGNLSFELCHSVCVSALDNLKLKLGRDWTDTFHVLLNLLAMYSHEFKAESWHTLLGIFKTRFVVANSSPPLEWPDNIKYKTTTQLCLPQEVLVCTSSEDAYLVGCVRHTIFLSRESLDSSLLREMGFLTPVSTQMVLEQLNFLTRQDIKHSSPHIVQRMVSHIYSYLDKNTDKITNPAIDIFIPDELSFVSAGRVVFSAPFDLKPYIYSLQDLHYSSDVLFRCIKVNESPSLKQLLNTLANIYRTCPTLTSTQLDLVINILNVIVTLERQRVGESVYIPGKDLKLYKPNEEKLVFCDQSWLNRSAIEEDFIFVHDKISNDTAYKLGVSPFSERIATPGEFWFEETGQQIAVTDRIRGILDGYHGTINVLKEMLQNADDAKATELNVVFDWRVHPKSSLLSPAMGAWQGPAILFYNNSTFRDVDFNNVMKIEGATKARDTTSIGQFGLGFCTVYHLTDVPSFVSRNYIHILDPHRQYLKRGAKIDFCQGRLAKYIQLYQDQFTPYQGLFGCDIFSHSSFNGTLFRLPIRTCDVTSKISHTAYDNQAIIRIQEDFIQEAYSLLFFMQYIDSLGIYSISPNSTVEDIELIHSVKRSKIHRAPSSGQPFLHSNSQLMENMLGGLNITPVSSTCEYSLSVTDKYSSKWIVAFATGSGPCVNILKKFPRPTAPLPFAGVAINLDLLDQGVTTGYVSNLYCFLPLPIQIQLPFHCHAMFELRHDRQGLVNTAEAKTEWNKVIVSDALVRAVFALYKELASRVRSMGGEDVLHTYTCLLFSVFTTEMINDPLWGDFAKEIAREIYRNKFSFFLVKSRKGMEWCNFKSTTFIHNPDLQSELRDYYSERFLDSVRNVLVECGYQVAMIPEICFENGGFLSFLLKSNRDNIFDFKKFSTFFFDKFTKFKFSKIVEILRVLISVSCHYSWLHELIKKCNCIPCGESEKLKLPHSVIDPNATLVVGLYEASESRHPTELCCEALFSRESQSLHCLINNFRVISVTLSVDELKSRASYIHKHKNEEIAFKFIEYLDQKIFTKSEVEAIHFTLKNLPFIPVDTLGIQRGNDRVSFHCPTQLMPHNTKELVELQLPVLPDRLAHYKAFISKMKIGITDYNLPQTLLLTAIEELTICIHGYSALVQTIDMHSKVKKIYEYLGIHFQSLQTKIDQLPKNNVLIPLVGFCPTSVLLLSSDEDFSPYIYSIQDHYDIFNKDIYGFFCNLGVRKTLSISQCNQTLEQLSKDSQKSPLNSNQQRIAIRLMIEICENSAPKREDSYFMLCLDNCVHLAHDCVFHDLSWHKRDYSGGVFTHKEKRYYFIHKHVSNDMAFCMGVKPLSEMKLSGRKLVSFSYTSHGQSEPLTTRLKNILIEYESDVDVFKEMTQNADDAGASEIKFLFDYSTHGVESLVHDEMRHWQGPAIYCYNNAIFSDKDFKDITMLASRSKITDHSTIGTFGTGFNAVYRLTDLPSFVSRRLITFFDPHVSYLKKLIEHDNPGMQIDFVNECEQIKDFPDQFSVYNGIFGCDLFSKREYKGTLFRLPLRTSKVTSKISGKSFDSHTLIQHLQEQLLDIAHDLILFLRNIQCIEIYTRRSPEQNMSLEYKLEKSLPNRFFSDNELHLRKLETKETHDPVTEVKTIELTTLSSSHPEPNHEEIIISHASGTVSSFSLMPELKQANEIYAIPFCAVALPKRFITLSFEEFSNVKCTLFSFLPIPCESPYPLHINGSFQLQPSRRAFFSTADDSIRTRWNQALINDALTIAVVNLLISLTDVFSNNSRDSSKLTTAQLERYYSFLPVNITKENTLWGTLASSVATRIITSNAPVFYCSLHPQRWISYKEVSFFLLPTQYTLDTEFVCEVVFPYSAQFGIYFMDLIPQFTKHDVFKELVETKGLCYNISRVCEEIFVRLFKEFEIDFQRFNTIHRILSTLLDILKFEPSIQELLSHTPCIPCGEDDCRLLTIPQVLSPNSIFRQIFYPLDKRLPHTLFHHLFDKQKSPETYHTLDMLGVITNTLPLGLLVDRCNMTLELSRIDKKQALQHSQCLLDYLNSLRLDEAQNVEIKNLLFDIPFIPVHQDDLFQMINLESRSVFSPPSKCCEYDSRHLSLDYHAITKEANSLCHALILLGISENDIPLESLINTLLIFRENEHLFTDQTIVESEVKKRCKAIYLNLANKCSPVHTQSNQIAEQNLQIVQGMLDGKAWLWHLSLKKFYSINQLVSSTAYISYRSSFLISFPYTDLLEKGTTTAEFFKNMKLARSVTSDMAIGIISLMKQHFGNDPLPSKEDSSEPDECGLVIRLINEVIKVNEHTKLDEMYLLTENNTLQLSKSLFNNDVPWMEFSEEEKRTLVNHRITLSASHNLGAGSKMDTFYDQEWEDFGQYEDISTRIANLLREFPCDVTIFKELIQNADDSQATEVAFILDCQQHKQESLCPSGRKPSWRELQTTPSLLVYNNKSFTTEDLQGIQAVGIGGKEGKNTIGRFGLGFNSVFHLTRCPCLLTTSVDGKETVFCVFDPHKEHLEIPKGKKPGTKMTFSTNEPNKRDISCFQDQFAPYFANPILTKYGSAMENLRRKKCFSIFRLPLNTLIDKKKDVKENLRIIRALLEQLVKEAPRLLPFIKNVKQIQLFEIGFDSDATRVFLNGTIKANTLTNEKVAVERPIAGYSKSLQIINREVSIECQAAGKSVKNSVRWLIYHFEGNVDIFYGRSELLQRHEHKYDIEKLRLFSSIAVEIVSENNPPPQKRYLYCHLPFGTSLNFPVHVNAPFILDPHRRYVSYQDETSGFTSWDNVWHREIMKLVLAPIYSKLLYDLGPGGSTPCVLSQKCYFDWYYSLFPVIHKTEAGSNSIEYLQSLGREALTRLYEVNSPILLADDIDKKGCRTWYRIHGPNAGVFRIQVNHNYVETMELVYQYVVNIEYPLTVAPISLAKSFQACSTDECVMRCKFINPLDVSQYINSNPSKLCKANLEFPCSLDNCIFTFDQLNILLNYVLTHFEKDPNAKHHIPCLPLKVDYANNLGAFRHSNITFTNQYANLLPQNPEQFLSKEYPQDIIKRLTDYGYVGELNVEFLSAHLVDTHQPSKEFFLLFWQFIKNSVKNTNVLFAFFSHLNLVPITYGRDCPVKPTFRPIAQLIDSATKELDYQLLQILYKFRCPFLYFDPYLVCEENPCQGIINVEEIHNFLKSLSIRSLCGDNIIGCVSNAKKIDVALDVDEAERLRSIFQNISFGNVSHMNWQTLTRIKMFVAESEHETFPLVALNEYSSCFMNDDKFPLSTNLIIKLREVFKLVFISPRSCHNNPTKLIQQICKRTGKGFLVLKEFVKSRVLHTEILPRLDFESQKSIILFIFSHLEDTDSWTSILKSLPFVYLPETPPYYFKPAQLYCPHVPLFSVFKKNQLLPQDWAKVNELYTICLKLGLNTKIELRDIVASASTVANNGIDCLDHKSLKLPILALINFIDSYIYAEDSREVNVALKRLSTTKFLPMEIRYSFRTTIDNPVVSWRLGSFCEAQLYKHHDYCCLSCPIFDSDVSFKSVRNEEFKPRFNIVMNLFGLKLDPHINDVKSHLRKLMLCCNTYSQQEINRHLKSLFFKTYEFLQNTTGPLPDFERENCILFTSKLFQPMNIVFECSDELSPYLFQCPHELETVRAFLVKLKVAESPSYEHFKYVLNCIRRDNESSQLRGGNLCRQAQRAFSCLISKLHSFPQHQQINLNGMLLLTDKNELIPYNSQLLFYADDTQLFNRMFAVASEFKILPPLNPNELGSFAPPQCLQIQLLSDRFRQSVSPAVYENFRREDILAETLKERLVSQEAYLGLKRIYFHDTQKDLDKVRIRNKKAILLAEGEHAEAGYLSIREKIAKLNIVSVDRIDIKITDLRTGVPRILENACICFVDESKDTILINVREESRQCLPVEMTYELNQYFANLFDRSLVHLLICHVYTGEDIGRTLSNFKIRLLA